MIYIHRLVWNEWNVAHIARHEVIPDEVEEVCNGVFIVRESYLGRLMLIGTTSSNRILAVILEPEGEGIFYPVTARPASRRERRLYSQERTSE